MERARRRSEASVAHLEIIQTSYNVVRSEESMDAVCVSASFTLSHQLTRPVQFSYCIRTLLPRISIIHIARALSLDTASKNRPTPHLRRDSVAMSYDANAIIAEDSVLARLSPITSKKHRLDMSVSKPTENDVRGPSTDGSQRLKRKSMHVTRF